MEHEVRGNTNYKQCDWNNPQRFGNGTRRLRNQRTSRDYPDNSTIKIGQNTEMKLGDLRRLPVTQTSVKHHQLTLMWNTLIIGIARVIILIILVEKTNVIVKQNINVLWMVYVI